MGQTFYGREWKDGVNGLHAALLMFREDGGRKYGVPVDGRAYYFKEVVKLLWPRTSKKPFTWNPWCDKMLKHACEEKYLFLSGCAGSGKTSFSALWGLVNWLCSPHNTCVVVTSTTVTAAMGRIWGELEGYFNAANESMNAVAKGAKLPGKMIGSSFRIKTEEVGQTFDAKCGIRLIAGDRAKEKDNIGHLIGLHLPRVILLADELPELSPALATAATSNLSVNPYFQMIGSGNFLSIYDPFGQVAEPLDGWASVTPDHDGWRTADGLCLRFDGLKSPNVLLGSQKYPGIYGPADLENHRKEKRENTAIFWRMCRSFPCPEADADRIYSDADLLKGDVKGTVRWLYPPTKCASLDPAFATGGDKAAAKFGLFGMSVDNVQVLQVYKSVDIREDVRKKDESRSTQVAKQFRDLCIAEGVAMENAAIDGSGGGLPFAALLTELWGPRFLSVQFGGAASDRPASAKDRRPSRDAFANRVAEIWFAGVDFVQGGQIKGLTNQICIELTERRRLPSVKSAGGIKLRIESKTDMKKRTGGRSPDDGDSFLVLLELARERLGFRATGMEGRRMNPVKSFQQRTWQLNQMWRNSDSYQPEEVGA